MYLELVESFNDIKLNMDVIDKYIERKTDPEYTYALELIKRGTCFLAIKTMEGYKFYPSRFVGYRKNTMEKHQNNCYKDGKETNPQITRILNMKLQYSEGLNAEYKKYCELLGFKPWEKGSFGVERKFWIVE